VKKQLISEKNAPFSTNVPFCFVRWDDMISARVKERKQKNKRGITAFE